ncbi:DUF4138 domain-containing protein [Sinomicrobium pectinilyticum]|uniref:DUF4138 domain-containing protein n=1 Tax=Sinomicrobium pectinilyticum TaxID=1084421 RepID=A0A3N0EQS3_SINP1|nr:DUF4138 domain-containing protein [Sinomicrobium pectinilyticum]RNL90121.1 DUF4138 domain-containing protein [Sinomicrobium pectinilyticum]
MRFTILFISILLCGSLQAQQAIDTLYANEKKNVALFFPSAIQQGITGASHFVFTYNREKEQYFGLLQAQPGEESNLLVVTDDGQVYSYILKYARVLPKLNYFVPEEESIGNEMPVNVVSEPTKIILDSIAKRTAYLKRLSEHLLGFRGKKLATKRKKGIKLQLQKMAYNGSETYLVMEITNQSGIAFEIDFLDVYRVSGNKKRKASYQKLLIEPLYKYKMPTKVWNSQSYRFVYVLPKFVLGDKEKLQLELSELKGSRKVLAHYR